MTRGGSVQHRRPTPTLSLAAHPTSTNVTLMPTESRLKPRARWLHSGPATKDGRKKNLDKRTARKQHRQEFLDAIAVIRQHVAQREADQPPHFQPPDAATQLEFNQQQQQQQQEQQHQQHQQQIAVFVRKRPVLEHEKLQQEFDVVTMRPSGRVIVHDCRMHPDMKHMFVKSLDHRFSHVFDEAIDTEQVYRTATSHLLAHAVQGNKAVCMMYGQTGSGKTYTMGGFFRHIADDLFSAPLTQDVAVSVAAVEIAGSNCFDLLQNSTKLQICDDADNNTRLLNLSELPASSSNDLLDLLTLVKDSRSTEATTVNSQSSRTHLVCYLNFRRQDSQKSLHGQLVLLDLAGSERNEDSFYHDAARRQETIEINKSHMALKECVRAIGREDSTGFVPYRASLLTRILKDCLWARDSRASVIANISPISVDTEHTLSTLLCAGQMLGDFQVTTLGMEQTEEEKTVVSVRSWDKQMVHDWFAKLGNNGEFASYAAKLGDGINGHLLTRMSTARFLQLCDGNAPHAEFLFKALRQEMAQQEALEKERRRRNITMRKMFGHI